MNLIPDDVPHYGGDIDADDAIEAMSADRIQIAFDRAIQEFGGAVADYESPEFEEEFANQLKLMVAKDETDSLVEKGILHREVNADGDFAFTLTTYGEKLLAAQ